MTILIPLGSGSIWKDNELRYCLRAIAKHVSGWDKIVIIGRKPDWLKVGDGLVFQELDEVRSTKRKEFNICLKIRYAINSGLVGSDFLFMNDDHFILQDVNAGSFPLHHKGLMWQCIAGISLRNTYRRTLISTLDYLKRKHFIGPFNYDTHCPIVYNSETFLKVVPETFPPFGYAIKSMYANQAGQAGTFYPDLKINEQLNADRILSLIDGRPYFSIGNRAIGPGLETVLNSLYPNKTVWEQ